MTHTQMANGDMRKAKILKNKKSRDLDMAMSWQCTSELLRWHRFSPFTNGRPRIGDCLPPITIISSDEKPGSYASNEERKWARADGLSQSHEPGSAGAVRLARVYFAISYFMMRLWTESMTGRRGRLLVYSRRKIVSRERRCFACNHTRSQIL